MYPHSDSVVSIAVHFIVLCLHTFYKYRWHYYLLHALIIFFSCIIDAGQVIQYLLYYKATITHHFLFASDSPM